MMPSDVSPQRRLDMFDAFRRGAVPVEGLDVLAVALAHLSSALRMIARDESLPVIDRDDPIVLRQLSFSHLRE